jgi:hypothetical protein
MLELKRRRRRKRRRGRWSVVQCVDNEERRMTNESDYSLSGFTGGCPNL